MDLKNEINNIKMHQNEFIKLKTKYVKLINSPRRFGKINSITDLLDTLIKQYLVKSKHEEERDIVQTICNKVFIVSNATDEKMLINYIGGTIGDLYNENNEENLYASSRKSNVSGYNNYAGYKIKTNCVKVAKSTTSEEKINHKNEIEEPYEMYRKKIYKLIASEIGRKWKDFGRALEISDGFLENIEEQQRDTVQRVYQIFKIFEEQFHPEKQFCKLCEALEDVKRKDLLRKIREYCS